MSTRRPKANPPCDARRGDRMSRLDVTEKIIATKVAKGLKWADVAAKVGQSKEWVTAACLGQMTLTGEQAGVGRPRSSGSRPRTRSG